MLHSIPYTQDTKAGGLVRYSGYFFMRPPEKINQTPVITVPKLTLSLVDPVLGDYSTITSFNLFMLLRSFDHSLIQSFIHSLNNFTCRSFGGGRHSFKKIHVPFVCNEEHKY
jgi:hypothetical protein